GRPRRIPPRLRRIPPRRSFPPALGSEEKPAPGRAFLRRKASGLRASGSGQPSLRPVGGR
ncbi:hypothetical protein TR75_00545, partial [Hydrogenibacillus schlegelii]